MWATATRRCEYTLGGHTASVNVVRWGGGGLDGKGVLYTASSDRTVRVWDSEGVSLLFFYYSGGKQNAHMRVGEIIAYA